MGSVIPSINLTVTQHQSQILQSELRRTVKSRAHNADTIASASFEWM